MLSQIKIMLVERTLYYFPEGIFFADILALLYLQTSECKLFSQVFSQVEIGLECKDVWFSLSGFS